MIRRGRGSHVLHHVPEGEHSRLLPSRSALLVFRPLYSRSVPRAALAALLVLTSCVPYAPRLLDPAANAAAVEGRRLDDPALRAYAEQSLGHPFATWPPPRWDLEALTAAALYFNPDVALARAAHAGALAAVTTAGERPNPTVNASLQHKDSDPALSPWVSSFGIDLTIETGGKRAARVGQARESAEAAQARIASAAWNARSRVRARLLDVYAAQLRAPLFTDEERIQNDIVAIFAKRPAPSEP